MIGHSDVRRAELYRSLAVLDTAGIPLLEAVERAGDKVLAPTHEALLRGEAVGDAFAASPGFSKLEVELVRAGSIGGRLPDVFSTLSRLFEARAAAKRQLLSDLAYPVILLHLGILLPSLGTLVSGGLGAYLRLVAVPFLILYGTLGVLYLSSRLLAACAPAIHDALASSIPILGSLRRSNALVLALTALEAVYTAGVTISVAATTAADACPSLAVSLAFRRIAQLLKEGKDIAEAFASEKGILPSLLIDQVRTGSVSGHLQEMLAAARKTIELEADHKRELAMRLIPFGIYLAVAAYVAWVIISFWTNLYGNMLR